MFLSKRIHLSNTLIYLMFLDIIGICAIIMGSVFIVFRVQILDLPFPTSTFSAAMMIIIGTVAMLWSVPKIFQQVVYQLAGDITPNSPNIPPPYVRPTKEVIYNGVDMDDFSESDYDEKRRR